MNRPRTFFGWVENGQFKVSVFSGAERKAANTYDTKEEAERDAIKNRTDRGHPPPKIEWEHDGSMS